MSSVVWGMSGAVDARWRRGNLRVGIGGDGGSHEYESSGVGPAWRGRGGGGVGSVRKMTRECGPKKTESKRWECQARCGPDGGAGSVRTWMGVGGLT